MRARAASLERRQASSVKRRASSVKHRALGERPIGRPADSRRPGIEGGAHVTAAAAEARLFRRQRSAKTGSAGAMPNPAGR